MNVAPATTEPPQPAIVGPLGRHASRGAFLFTLQTLVLKVASFAGAVFLARLIAPAAYGLFSSAATAAGFPALIQSVGGSEILVQRSRHFRRWANASFWMSIALGLLSAVLILLIAPVAGYYYAENHVFNRAIVPLVIVFSLGPLFSCFAVGPAARLQIDLRFGFQARFGFFVALVSIVVSVGLAWKGFNAYALAIPLVLTALIRVVVFWVVAPVPVKWHPQFKRWKYLVSDRGYLLASAIFALLQSQGDYMTLGHLRGMEVTGIYYWAFNLSMQSAALIGLNLATVLFPSLSLLNAEPQRLAAAFHRAVRLLVAVGAPLCILQAVVAQPLIYLLFQPKWYSGIPIFQILSVGMAFQIVNSPMLSLLSAQGRFRTLMIWSAFSAITFVATVYEAASMFSGFSSAIAVAVAAACFFLVTGPLGLVVAYRGAGLPISHVWRVYAIPLFGSIISGLVAWYLIKLFPTGRSYYYILQLAGGSFMMLGLYTLIIYILNAAMVREFYALFHDILLSRFFKKRSTS